MSKNMPAFPMKAMEIRNGQAIEAVYDRGMTLRDYFAAQAMQAIIRMTEKDMISLYSTNVISKMAYIQADNMLEARKS